VFNSVRVKQPELMLFEQHTVVFKASENEHPDGIAKLSAVNTTVTVVGGTSVTLVGGIGGTMGGISAPDPLPVPPGITIIGGMTIGGIMIVSLAAHLHLSMNSFSVLFLMYSTILSRPVGIPSEIGAPLETSPLSPKKVVKKF